MCFINRLFICLSVYSLTYCLLLVVNTCWRRQSCPSRAAAAVELRVRRSVMGFVCIVWQNGRRLLLGAYKWEDYLSWTCCLHTCVYVILWKGVHAWAFSNHSDLSTVRSTQPHECTQRAGAPAPTRPLFVFISPLRLVHKSQKNLVSFSIFIFLFSLPFFSSLLANLISPPPLSSLPLLSSFSHAPVGEHNTIAMAVLCMVCVWCHTTTAL